MIVCDVRLHVVFPPATMATEAAMKVFLEVHSGVPRQLVAIRRHELAILVLAGEGPEALRIHEVICWQAAVHRFDLSFKKVAVSVHGPL